MDKDKAIQLLLKYPYKFGHMLGFTKLTELHNKWMLQMLKMDKDKTLQAHRGSFKTTCVSIVLAILIILRPNKRILFIRKTDGDIKEICRQVAKILKDPHTSYLVQLIYGVNLILTTETQTEISTNLSLDTKGTNQLTCIGLGGSLTGKHYDYIFTDDIVNLQDRISRAERERTKIIYQELQNVKNRGGVIFNSGTPWHKDDAFQLMPNPEKYDCYTTGLIGEEELKSIKSKMLLSLFSANYELKHIASEDVIFTNPQYEGDLSNVEQGICHIDAAYGGEDWTAFTVIKKFDNKLYVLGKCWRKHVDDCIEEIINYINSLNLGKLYCEDNGDKGYLAKSLRNKGIRTTSYHENMNKFIKITSYLKPVWEEIYFVQGTDEKYIEQVCDYNEHVEHDDCPDSLSCIIRIINKKGNEEKYIPLWN